VGLLVDPFCRTLRSEFPAFHTVCDRPQRKVLTIEMLDRKANSIACPQRKRELQLVRCLIDETLLGLSVLIAGQLSLVAKSVTSLTGLYEIKTATFVLFSNCTDLVLIETSDFGNGLVV